MVLKKENLFYRETYLLYFTDMLTANVEANRPKFSSIK